MNKKKVKLTGNEPITEESAKPNTKELKESVSGIILKKQINEPNTEESDNELKALIDEVGVPIMDESFILYMTKEFGRPSKAEETDESSRVKKRPITTDRTLKIKKKQKVIDYDNLEVPDNLKPIKEIFGRPFHGLFYDEVENLFYSTHTRRKTKTFQPIKWININYVHPKGTAPKKVYRYVYLPTGVKEGEYERVPEDDWIKFLESTKPIEEAHSKEEKEEIELIQEEYLRVD
jgi:hypothetical protein